MSEMEKYRHNITTERGKESRVAIHFKTGDWEKELDETSLNSYKKANEYLLQNQKVSKMEVKVFFGN